VARPGGLDCRHQIVAASQHGNRGLEVAAHSGQRIGVDEPDGPKPVIALAGQSHDEVRADHARAHDQRGDREAPAAHRLATDPQHDRAGETQVDDAEEPQTNRQRQRMGPGKEGPHGDGEHPGQRYGSEDPGGRVQQRPLEPAVRAAAGIDDRQHDEREDRGQDLAAGFVADARVGEERRGRGQVQHHDIDDDPRHGPGVVLEEAQHGPLHHRLASGPRERDSVRIALARRHFDR
jgi:hypothetical protein